jgi:hypothetical protein
MRYTKNYVRFGPPPQQPKPRMATRALTKPKAPRDPEPLRNVLEKLVSAQMRSVDFFKKLDKYNTAHEVESIAVKGKLVLAEDCLIPTDDLPFTSKSYKVKLSRGKTEDLMRMKTNKLDDASKSIDADEPSAEWDYPVDYVMGSIADIWHVVGGGPVQVYHRQEFDSYSDRRHQAWLDELRENRDHLISSELMQHGIPNEEIEFISRDPFGGKFDHGLIIRMPNLDVYGNLDEHAEDEDDIPRSGSQKMSRLSNTTHLPDSKAHSFSMGPSQAWEDTKSRSLTFQSSRSRTLAPETVEDSPKSRSFAVGPTRSFEASKSQKLEESRSRTMEAAKSPDPVFIRVSDKPDSRSRTFNSTPSRTFEGQKSSNFTEDSRSRTFSNTPSRTEVARSQSQNSLGGARSRNLEDTRSRTSLESSKSRGMVMEQAKSGIFDDTPERAFEAAKSRSMVTPDRRENASPGNVIHNFELAKSRTSEASNSGQNLAPAQSRTLSEGRTVEPARSLSFSNSRSRTFTENSGPKSRTFEQPKTRTFNNGAGGLGLEQPKSRTFEVAKSRSFEEPPRSVTRGASGYKDPSRSYEDL